MHFVSSSTEVAIVVLECDGREPSQGENRSATGGNGVLSPDFCAPPTPLLAGSVLRGVVFVRHGEEHCLACLWMLKAELGTRRGIGAKAS